MTPQEAAHPTRKRVIPAILVLVFGILVILDAAFAHSEAIHNGAHDARHAFGFPCH